MDDEKIKNENAILRQIIAKLPCIDRDYEQNRDGTYSVLVDGVFYLTEDEHKLLNSILR